MWLKERERCLPSMAVREWRSGEQIQAGEGHVNETVHVIKYATFGTIVLDANGVGEGGRGAS